MVSKVLLVGCGRIGTDLGLRLIARGHHVIGVRRRADQLPASFESISADLSNPAGVDLPEVEAVVITLSAQQRTAGAYARTYLGGLDGLATGLARMPRRVIFVSSTSVLGPRGGEVVTERDAARPASETARVLARAETQAREVFDAIVLRPAGIYGPGRISLLRRVLQADEFDYARVSNRIHSADLVAALQRLLEAEQPPRLLHAVDREPAELGTVVRFVAERLSVPAPPRSAPGQPSKPGGPDGKILDGTAFDRFSGPLQFPTFREGYDDLLRDFLAARQ